MKHDLVTLPPEPTFKLRNARVPVCMLADSLKPVAATVLVDKEGLALFDLRIEAGRIASLSIASGGAKEAGPLEIDLEGRMIWPGLVDMHAHLDKGEVIPRVEPDGTIPGAARMNRQDEANWTDVDLTRRMEFGLRCAFIQGVSGIRTHLDYRPVPESSWDVFDGLRSKWAGRVALQGVGLCGLDLFPTPEGKKFAKLLVRMGGIMGGVTDALGTRPGMKETPIDDLLDGFFNVAGEHGLDVDLHADQGPEPFYLPNIAQSVLRTGYKGKVVVDHCVNLALQTDEVARRTIELCAQAGLSFVTLPTPMMYLQDRVPGRTPRWRGVTLLQEIHAAGIPIAIAGDNCRDYWFPYGDHDMVDIYRQGVRVFQIDHPIADSPALVGPVPAKIIGLKQVGAIGKGFDANLILFRARTLNELLSRPQSDRIVLNRGVRITEPLPDYTELD